MFTTISSLSYRDFNPFPKKALVFSVCRTILFGKRYGKRRNCSWRAISPLSHSVLYPNGELSAIFIEFEIVVCKVLSLKYVVWERLNAYSL